MMARRTVQNAGQESKRNREIRRYIADKTAAGWTAEKLQKAVWLRFGRPGSSSGDSMRVLMSGGLNNKPVYETFAVNPARRENVTDRALRYRAQRNVTGPKRCVICGSTRNIDVMHLDGNESHGEPENLAYGCRSCNGKLAAAFKAIGVGRPTNQYNPAKGDIPTFAQYAFAVSSGERDYYPASSKHAAGSHDEAGAIIHATPHHKRVEYAQRLAAARKGRRRSSNPYEPGNFIGDLFGLTGGDRIYKPGKGSAHSGGMYRDYSPAQAQKRAAADKQFERKQDRASAANAKFLEREASRERVAGEKRQRKEAIASKPVSAGSYKGYTISKTPDGEYFSSLDRSSWFDTVAQAKRHIDQYQKGRGNPGISDGQAGAYAAFLSAKERLQSLKKHIADVEAEMHGRKLMKSELQVLRNRFQAGVREARKRGQRNPASAAASAFEDFHGHPSAEVVTVKRKVHTHEHLAAAGELRGMSVKPVGSGLPVRHIGGLKDAILAFNEAKNQLFVRGGDQSMSDAELKKFGILEPHEVETLGKVLALDYYTTKTHLGKEGGTAVYGHKLRTTNENGRHVVVEIARYPDLIYRTLDQQFEFSGGSYEIRAEGIDK